MRRHWAYLKYVARHKWFVFLECIELDVPLWMAVLHDLDKFLPDEWFPYAHAFYTPNGDNQYQPSLEFDYAWNLHQKRNKHHWQSWVLIRDTGEIVALSIPYVYFKEMLADWIGTGRALGEPDIRGWYEDNKRKMILHSRTRIWIDLML